MAVLAKPSRNFMILYFSILLHSMFSTCYKVYSFRL
jgi:hypothetical protein